MRGPAYNEYFNAQESARSNRVLVVSELVVNGIQCAFYLSRTVVAPAAKNL